MPKAPVFCTAIGHRANIDGAAGALVVASVFHPALAPVAVPGHAPGTHGGWISGQLLLAGGGMKKPGNGGRTYPSA